MDSPFHVLSANEPLRVFFDVLLWIYSFIHVVRVVRDNAGQRKVVKKPQ